MLPPATGFFPHPSSTGDCSTTTTTSNTCRPGLLSGCSEVEAMSNAGGLPRDGFSTAASGVFAATSGIVANPGVAPSVGDALFVGVESPACK